ncbi:MAG: hypothetical protein EOP33_02465 [Rickettsiaceae bacterium]|nr:MAG: hypothetical protein EOP33_02465 [Rickettsiaceae bacterium]
MITADKYSKLKKIEAKFGELFNNQQFADSEQNKTSIDNDKNAISNPFQFLLEVEKHKLDGAKLNEFTSKIINGLCVIKLGITNGELQKEHLKKLRMVLQKSRSNLSFLGLNEEIESILIHSEMQLAKS